MKRGYFIAGLLVACMTVSVAEAGPKRPLLPPPYTPPPPNAPPPLKPPPGGHPESPDTAGFYKCPGGRCLLPRVDDPRGGGVNPEQTPYADRRFAIIQMIQAECAWQPSIARANACAMNVCAANAPSGLTPPQLGQYCSTLASSALGR